MKLQRRRQTYLLEGISLFRQTGRAIGSGLIRREDDLIYQDQGGLVDHRMILMGDPFTDHGPEPTS